MVSVLAKIAELHDFIVKHIGSLDKDCDQIVEKSDLLMKELMRVGLARKAIVQPGQVRVHLRNRNGLGVDAAEVHSLCKMLVGNEAGAGVSKKVIQGNSVCFELPPDGADLDAAVKFNTHLVMCSQGMLAQWDENPIGFL